LETADHGDLTLATAQAESAAAGSADLATVLGSSGRVAIIADEAHRHHDSHTSEQIADILAAVFGSSSGAGSKQLQQQQQQQQLVIRKKSGLAASRAAAAAAGGSSSNLQSLQQQQQQQQQQRFVTYFGFTATPGPRALQLFGVARQVQVDVLGQVVTVQPTTPAAAAAVDDNRAQAGNAAVAAAAVRHSSDDGEYASRQQQQQQQQQQAAALPLEPHMAPATLYTPFHCYSLQQAVADGLVLDVLQRFVAVTPRFQIAGLQLSRQQQLQLQQLNAASRAVQGSAGTGVQGGLAGGVNPGSSARGSAGDDAGLQALLHVVGRKRARRAAAAEAAAAGGTAAEAAAAATAVDSSSSSSTNSLAEGLLVQAASNSRQLVATKAEDVVGRFLAAWAEAAGCGFVGFRAMLVVRSRQHVVWYCQEIRRLLAQHAEQVQQLLAVAGTHQAGLTWSTCMYKIL
jgi:hypothetical protein